MCPQVLKFKLGIIFLRPWGILLLKPLYMEVMCNLYFPLPFKIWSFFLILVLSLVSVISLHNVLTEMFCLHNSQTQMDWESCSHFIRLHAYICLYITLQYIFVQGYLFFPLCMYFQIDFSSVTLTYSFFLLKVYSQQ